MNTVFTTEFWRRCSSCKNPIAYRASHFVCSVSTCTRKRVGYVFCTVHCWERHLPGARHRDAAAIEAVAPKLEDWKAELEAAGEGGGQASGLDSGSNSGSNSGASPDARSPQRVLVRNPSTATSTSKPVSPNDPLEQEILVVVSKLKSYVRSRSEMNTSDSVMEVLSRKLRRLCDRAIDNARADGRKTVMDRDFD